MSKSDPPPELFCWVTWIDRMVSTTLERYPEIPQKAVPVLETRAKAA